MVVPDLTIVIPAYNEARRLPPTLAAWAAWLATRPETAEVVVVDDGSRDHTASVVEAFAADHPVVRLLRLPQNQGKGGAVRAGMLDARGEYVFYVDADLNIAPHNVAPALALLRSVADVVVGRRSLSEYTSAERSWVRLAAGAAVQITRRPLVLPTITDTQAGFKGFRRDVARAVFERARIASFAFDIEALYIARKLGARLVEMPVSVEFREESTYNVRKHLPPFLRDIVRVRTNALRGRYR